MIIFKIWSQYPFLCYCFMYTVSRAKSHNRKQKNIFSRISLEKIHCFCCAAATLDFLALCTSLFAEYFGTIFAKLFARNLMNVSLCPQHICSCQLQAFYRVGNSRFIYSVKFSFLTLNLNLMTRYTQRMCCQKMFLSSFGEIVIQILLIPPAEEDTDKRPKIILTNVKSLPLCDLTDG